MKYLLSLFLIIGIITPNFAQIEEDEEEEMDEGIAGTIFFGLNIGGIKPNNKPALIYNGFQTEFGIPFYFNNINFQQELDNYFIYNYRLVFPQVQTVRYRTTYNVGGHAGVHLDESIAIYADINITKIKAEDVFTVEVDNPNDPSLTGNAQLQQLPIFGSESRTNLNLGLQATFYEEGPLKSYFNLFGNVNNTRLEENFFVINNQKYPIRHNAQTNGIATNGQVNFTETAPPGGIGFGGGAGLGAKYKFNDKFTFDLNYYATYTNTRMNAEFKPYGLNHALMLRILWG